MKTHTILALSLVALPLTARAGEEWRAMGPDALRSWLGGSDLLGPRGAEATLGLPDEQRQPSLSEGTRAALIWAYQLLGGYTLDVHLARQGPKPVRSNSVKEYSLWKVHPDGTREEVWTTTPMRVSVRKASFNPKPYKGDFPPADYKLGGLDGKSKQASPHNGA